MATLIKTSSDIKEFVSTAFNFTFTNIEPYVKRAEREFIKSLIGSTLYDSWTASAPASGTTKEVYDLLREASANLSVFLYIPVGSVNIADNGILVVESTTAKQADWWKVRDLQRSISNLGFSAIDEALKLMEANEELFVGWSASEGYTVFKELMVPKTQDFQRHFNINNSRRTFLALRSYQLEAQAQIFSWLDATTLDQIKTATSGVPLTALDYARAAQVNHTVAKAVESGLFEMTSTGLFFISDVLPGSGITGNYTKISEQDKLAFINARQQTADEWLKKLKTYILDNTEVFTSFEESTADTTVFVHNTKSIVTF